VFFTGATRLKCQRPPRPATTLQVTNWAVALSVLTSPATEIRRLAIGDHDAFDVFRPEIDIEVLGPITDTVNGKPGLRYFGSSAGHTINGHSVVLRMRHGNVTRDDLRT
jgi:hypothetical protein